MPLAKKKSLLSEMDEVVHHKTQRPQTDSGTENFMRMFIEMQLERDRLREKDKEREREREREKAAQDELTTSPQVKRKQTAKPESDETDEESYESMILYVSIL